MVQDLINNLENNFWPHDSGVRYVNLDGQEIEDLIAYAKKLEEELLSTYSNSCVECNFLNYSTKACSYECNHPTHGCWLDSDGCGCSDNTRITEVLKGK